MGAWGKDQGAGDKVMMLADGNGDFTRAVGLELDATKFGMGKRSQRYSMVVDNGVVKQLNVEEPGAFEVSSAEHMMACYRRLCAERRATSCTGELHRNLARDRLPAPTHPRAHFPHARNGPRTQRHAI